MMMMMMMMMTTRTKMSQSFLLYVLSKICTFSDANSAQVSNIFMIIHIYVYTYPGSEKHQTFPLGNREFCTWIILKNYSLFGQLDFQGVYKHNRSGYLMVTMV